MCEYMSVAKAKTFIRHFPRIPHSFFVVPPIFIGRLKKRRKKREKIFEFIAVGENRRDKRLAYTSSACVDVVACSISTIFHCEKNRFQHGTEVPKIFRIIFTSASFRCSCVRPSLLHRALDTEDTFKNVNAERASSKIVTRTTWKRYERTIHVNYTRAISSANAQHLSKSCQLFVRHTRHFACILLRIQVHGHYTF